MQKPSWIDRARLAWHVYRRGIPQRKAAPFVWPAFRAGKPEWQFVDVQAYIDEGFNLNSLIYSAIMYKVRAASAAPLRAYRGDPDQPESLPESHPLAQLVARPNPHQSWLEMHGQSIVYLNIAGNCYTYLDRPRRLGGLPAALWNLRPDRVYIVPDDQRGIRGYLYVPEGKGFQDGVPILPADMMHVKLPNPGDPLEGMGYGLSPISPLARSGDVDNRVTEYLKVFFDRGTAVSHAITYDIPLTPEMVDELRERWQDVYGGHLGWTKPAVLDRGSELQRIGLTFDEMGFEGLDERNESRILGPFGVPPILIGSRIGLSRSTYANYAEARRHFWEDTMVPEMGIFEAEQRYYLQADDGSFVAYDLSGVPALRRNIPELIEAWAKLVDRGVPKDVAAGLLGLELGELEDAGVGYMPISMVAVTGVPEAELPVSGAEQPESEPEPEPPEDEEILEAEEDDREEAGAKRGGETKAVWSLEQKAALGKAVDRIATAWEGRFEEATRQALETNRRDVLAMVSAAQKEALRRKATVAWQEVLLNVKDYLSMDGAGADSWREIFVPLLQGVISDSGEHWKATLGIEFDVENIFATQWFDDYVLTFAQEINQTTLDVLGDVLQQATAEGWSIPDMQKRLETLFQQWMEGGLTAEEFAWYAERLPPYRTEMISRTATLRAANAGSTRLFKEWGVKEKEWLAAHDTRTREAHQVGAGWGDPLIVDIDAVFVVGGEKLQYPGDPAGSAKNVISCRCAVLPVIPKRGGRNASPS